MERNVVHRNSSSFVEWFRYNFLVKKMATPVGILFFTLISVSISYITVLVSYKAGVSIVVLFGALLFCLLCILYPVFGFYFVFIISIFIVLPERILNTPNQIPSGLVPEFFSYLVLLGVMIRQKYRGEIDSAFWGNAITALILLQLGYLLIEFFNPYMGSKLGWFNYFRKQASFVTFFYTAYCILNSRKAIVGFTRFWIVLSTVEALYACKQQWFGLFAFEYKWLISDADRYNLFVNWGFLRKFGLLSDPASAGILYSCATILLVILGFRAKKLKSKVIYSVLAVINFLGASYTGTRTGTLMIVAGALFYCIMTLYEKRTLIFSAIFGFLLTALMVAPIYDSVIINRMRSTFKGSRDPSAYVRDINRRSIQPYVYRHPIGGGLNTSGQVGAYYNPGHILSSIPPDSGYMQVLMEQGPIGFIILLVFYYAILRTGIKNYYRSKGRTVRTLYLGHLIAIFTLLVSQFSQMAGTQYPGVLYFYSALVILLKLHKYDFSTKDETTYHES